MIERIGRYQVTGELGRGAMGVVYRAEDPAIGRTVAIKTIHLDGQPDSSARLRREAQLAGMLSHPNIVTIYDIQEEGQQAHIFMEFVDGQTLETLMSRGEAVSPENALNWLQQIAEALDYAHAKGIVHRDIKPANIMVQQGHTAKVTDFGVARVNNDLTTGATMAGTLLGTPSYMAPEQIESERVDGRADQYSLAVMAYELLTGERPFASESLPGLMYKIVHDEPAEASRVNASLAHEASDVLSRALHKSRDQRYSDCRAFVRDLRAALALRPGWRPLPRGASESMPTLVPEPAPALNLPPPRAVEHEEIPKRRRWPWLMAAAIVLAAIAGTGWWFVSRPAEIPPLSVRFPTPAAPALSAPVVTPTVSTPLEEAPVAPPPVVAEEPGVELHKVRIETTPPASVTVDGTERGCLSPCDMPLTAGSHRIAAERAGYRTEVRGIEVPREAPVIIQLVQLTGTLAVQSNPPGASVSVDGVAWPQRTPTRATLPVGKHKLVVTREDSVKNEQEIEIRENAITTITVDWNTAKP